MLSSVFSPVCFSSWHDFIYLLSLYKTERSFSQDLLWSWLSCHLTSPPNLFPNKTGWAHTEDFQVEGSIWDRQKYWGDFPQKIPVSWRWLTSGWSSAWLSPSLKLSLELQLSVWTAAVISVNQKLPMRPKKKLLLVRLLVSGLGLEPRWLLNRLQNTLLVIDKI